MKKPLLIKTWEIKERGSNYDLSSALKKKLTHQDDKPVLPFLKVYCYISYTFGYIKMSESAPSSHDRYLKLHLLLNKS